MIPSPWTLIDADGDGNNWSVVQITNQNGSPSTVYPTPVLRSASWNATTQAALTPNNWIFSHAIDLSGRIVRTLNNATTINVSDLSAGTYLIDITTNEGKASSKFIKK